jgi:hypothetical protein
MNMQNCEHGFRSYKTAEKRAKELEKIDGKPRQVLNLGLFCGLSVVVKNSFKKTA